MIRRLLRRLRGHRRPSSIQPLDPHEAQVLAQLNRERDRARLLSTNPSQRPAAKGPRP